MQGYGPLPNQLSEPPIQLVPWNRDEPSLQRPSAPSRLASYGLRWAEPGSPMPGVLLSSLQGIYEVLLAFLKGLARGP